MEEGLRSPIVSVLGEAQEGRKMYELRKQQKRRSRGEVVAVVQNRSSQRPYVEVVWGPHGR